MMTSMLVTIVRHPVLKHVFYVLKRVFYVLKHKNKKPIKNIKDNKKKGGIACLTPGVVGQFDADSKNVFISSIRPFSAFLRAF